MIIIIEAAFCLVGCLSSGILSVYQQLYTVNNNNMYTHIYTSKRLLPSIYQTSLASN